MNGVSLQRKPLVIREGRKVTPEEIETTPRIGISRAVDWPLRYTIRGNPYVSRVPRARKSAPAV
jgi:DNA-3-methyladenine glycosylase